ncbi:uncharacterized protein MONBRDRAFT_8482 [Monosiga brevicollis MX1]|uniref:IBB domain-containing protein n=1 Tax=Monosiga brevicollis TaxID=81824 RepID=A9V061_MONBE|nr:uncharacterized protein MONBRDRAFT_8482 [Monosiga brevicollis MX1]EDQ88954.1 predicted protein [Monosiga brevicollis MX1]|eukprot:XP_001746059.1 hypothetical protein [Monosiga brevicollis MX1]
MADRMTQYKFKGRDTETMRGKRRDFAVSLRKDKRKEKFDADGQAIAALRPKIENDADPATQMEALVQLRRLLAAPKELPIQATLESGVIGKLVQLLGHQNSDVQYETAWILTNISSGKPHQTAAVVEAQAIIPLCHLLSSPHGKVKDQACWCLGNIAGDGAMLRDTLIQVGALERFLQMLCEEQDLDLLRNVSWTVSNFFRWKNPPAPFEKMSMSLEVLRNCLSEDPEVLSNVCWAICYIAESGEELLDTILKTYGAYFMSLLSLPSHDAQLSHRLYLGAIGWLRIASSPLLIGFSLWLMAPAACHPYSR